MDDGEFASWVTLGLTLITCRRNPDSRRCMTHSEEHLLDGGARAPHTAAMTELPKPRAETTEQFLVQSGPELAALCTACGACFDACPMVDHVGLRRADSHQVTEGLRSLASGESAPEETVSWVGACTRSGLCVSACPQAAAGLDAMLLVRIAKQHAINETRQLPPKYDQGLFPRVKAFARMQLSDEELETWL
jgi:ferredoxin